MLDKLKGWRTVVIFGVMFLVGAASNMGLIDATDLESAITLCNGGLDVSDGASLETCVDKLFGNTMMLLSGLAILLRKITTTPIGGEKY